MSCAYGLIFRSRVWTRSPGDLAVFGDTAHKIDSGWSARGGYAGFRDHLHALATEFDHIHLHPEIWRSVRPASSMPAHLLLKAVQRIDPAQYPAVLRALRRDFFERGLDISQRSVLQDSLRCIDVDVDQVQALMDSGVAHADLEADRREQQRLLVQGSPTYVLNEGRQKLYGNVGYGVIEANIKELLRSPAAGAASWC